MVIIIIVTKDGFAVGIVEAGIIVNVFGLCKLLAFVEENDEVEVMMNLNKILVNIGNVTLSYIFVEVKIVAENMTEIIKHKEEEKNTVVMVNIIIIV